MSDPAGSTRAPSRVWAIAALTLLAVLVCAALGAWQFDRARTRDTPRMAGDPMAAPPVPLAQVVPSDGRVPQGAQPRAVTVTGTYDGDHQLVVPGRAVGGQQVEYVVTPLEQSSGDAVLVARGWVPGALGGAAPPPPSGIVTVTGWLVPSESLDAGAVDPLSLPDGQVATVTAARVAGLLPYPIVDGYVGLVDEVETPTTEPQGPVAPPQVNPLPVPQVAPSVKWSVQSLFYAIEWWFFALVVIWMGVQAVRIERRRLAEAEPEAPATAQAADAPAAPPAP